MTNAAITHALDVLVDRRKRIIRQVVGDPAFAAVAVAEDSRFSAPHPAPAEQAAQAPEKVASRRWLDNLAQKSPLFRSIYEELTPWGSQNRYERNERSRNEEAAQHQEKVAERRRVNEALKATDEDRQFLSQVDREVLEALSEKGYFTDRATVENIGDHEGPDGPSARVFPGLPGRVSMVNDRLGDYQVSLKSTADEKVKKVEQWRAGNEPDHKEQVYTRWFILFHEAAHCEYAKIANPFQPSPDRADPDAVKALNRWTFGPLGVNSQDSQTLLNENHSDVYGAMMLLEATNHDPAAYKVLHDQYGLRRHIRAAGDVEFADSLGTEKYGHGALPVVHATDSALARVLNSAQEWKGKPPEQLKALALQFASDGVLDFASPGRQALGDGADVGTRFAQGLVPQDHSLAFHRGVLLSMARSYASNGDPKAWLEGMDDTHPSHALIKQSWDELLPHLQKNLSGPVPTHPGLPSSYSTKNPTATFADGVRASDPDSLSHLKMVVATAPTPLADPSHPLVQASLKGFEGDQASFGKLVGQEVSSPSMPANTAADGVPQGPSVQPDLEVVIPSLSQWRKARQDKGLSPSPSGPSHLVDKPGRAYS